MVELEENGSPKYISMPMIDLDNQDPSSLRIQRIRKWASSEKPYTVIQAQTSLSTGEFHLLYDAAKRLGSGNYANLGVAAGKSVGCMAWGLKHNNHIGKIYAIDIYNYEEEKYTLEGLTKTLSSVIEYVEFCKGFTHEWAETLKNTTFKFVFIDADHNYETCKLDWDLWSPLVEIGGEVAFHDTHKNTVDKVVNEIDKTKWEQTDHIWSTKLFKRIN